MTDPSDLLTRFAICEAALAAQSQTNAALIARLDALRSLAQTAIAWLEAINPGISGQFVTELERIEGDAPAVQPQRLDSEGAAGEDGGNI